ncbi:MAG: DUF5606 domain-containing protein [Bacteroidales bacterium]
MDLSNIMAISGKSGLFRIVSQTKGGLIVESLADGKKMPVFATHRSSVLDDISMFTYGEDVALKTVLWNIYQKENGQKVSIDLKAEGSVLFAYFEEVLPDFDKDRVYSSDIKKVLAWYNLLLDHNLITEPVEEQEDTPTEETADAAKKENSKEATAETKEAKSTAKKPAAKKAAPKNKKAGE